MPNPTLSGLDPDRPGNPADQEHLIVEARCGNREAFRVLVERHMREIYALAYRYVRDHQEADEIAQETFVRAFEALPGFREEAEFRTWVYRIAMNLAINSRRAERRRHDRETPASVLRSIPGIDGMDEVGKRELADHLERALHQLPTLQRAAVILRHIQGLSTRQVSAILHCSEGTVKTHLFRGLEKLRRRLKYLREDTW